MKIVVVSDSHRNQNILYQIVDQNKDADLFLHAGDSELTEDETSPFISVKGNCDREYRFKNSFELDTEVGKLYMTHGHQLSYINEEYLNSMGCNIFIYGHTHRHRLDKIGDCYVVNPGSVSVPRDSTNGSYLIIDIKNKKAEFIFKYL